MGGIEVGQRYMNLVCIKTGKKYSPDYVNRLYAMARRNVTGTLNFLCITDDRSGIRDEVQCEQPIAPWLDGWWHKLPLFAYGSLGLAPRFTAIDLDCVITGPIDFLDDDNGPWIGIKDFHFTERYNGSLWTMVPGHHARVWEEFVKEPDRNMEWKFDDVFFSDVIQERIFYQDRYPGKILSYKADVKDKPLPADAAIVFFHGLPKPHQVDDPWVKEHWSN